MQINFQHELGGIANGIRVARGRSIGTDACQDPPQELCYQPALFGATAEAMTQVADDRAPILATQPWTSRRTGFLDHQHQPPNPLCMRSMLMAEPSNTGRLLARWQGEHIPDLVLDMIWKLAMEARQHR